MEFLRELTRSGLRGVKLVASHVYEGLKALVVATDTAWLPQSYLNDSNNLVGYDIDVARELTKRLGDLEVSF